MEDFETFKVDFDSMPLHKMFGIELIERRPGYGKICLRKDGNTPTGIGGSVHGGILAMMVDIVMLVAIFTERRADEQPAGTADLNISYLRPAHGGQVFAEAIVVKRGRQLAMIEVDIKDEDDRLCARGRTLYAFRR